MGSVGGNGTSDPFEPEASNRGSVGWAANSPPGSMKERGRAGLDQVDVLIAPGPATSRQSVCRVAQVSCSTTTSGFLDAMAILSADDWE
jgi:hypothetical protein